jgi:type II secretory pathway pseudopilin PulG
MNGKRGTTLIEAVIAIVVVAVVVVTFLQALTVGITGTMDISRKTSALNLAKSQIEYVKAMSYNVSTYNATSNLSTTYGVITTNTSNISDKVNYNINGQVIVKQFNNVTMNYNYNGTTNQSLQQIVVNVSYLTNKQLQLTDYKTADGSYYTASSRGLAVTDNIKNFPRLPEGHGISCEGQFKGYYHVFTTGSNGTISATWKFNWNKDDFTIGDMGCPMMAIYRGVPSWASRDYLGVVRQDGFVLRNQNDLKGFASWISQIFTGSTTFGMGDLPGLGNGNAMCKCCDTGSCQDESNPIAWDPHSHSYGFNWWNWFDIRNICTLPGAYDVDNSYPCCGYAGSNSEVFWNYDSNSNNVHYGYNVQDTLVTPSEPAGTYTVLFFNAETKINIDTVSASVTYYK